MATIYRSDKQTNENRKLGDYWTREEALNIISSLIEHDYLTELKNRTDALEAFYLGKAAAHNIETAHNARRNQNKFLSFNATYWLYD